MKNDIRTAMNSGNASSEHGDIFKGQYFKMNEQLLYTCGLGPSQPLKNKIPRIVALLLASVVVMAAQVRAMIGAWGHFNLFVECFTPIESNVVGVLKIVTAVVQGQQTHAICNKMQKDWDDMRHSSQVNILKKYAEKGRLWTLFYFILIYGGLYLWIIIAFTPKVMDSLVPLNHSRRRFDLFPVDFMVDPDDYFYAILIFLAIGVSCQFLVTVAIDTLYMVIAQHVCAMFEILRYNLQTILEDTESVDMTSKSGIDEDKHYHEIINCIKTHKMIIEYVKSIESACGWRLLIIMGLSMIGLSATGYLVVEAGNAGSLVDIMRFACFGTAQVFHMFCNTLPSHWIMESSSLIPNSAYSCRWYMMSLRSRRLILFLIRASIEPCKITAGKIYVVSMENFSGVLQTSMSYLAMLNSLQ